MIGAIVNQVTHSGKNVFYDKRIIQLRDGSIVSKT
jgi:hypothetical protein